MTLEKALNLKKGDTLTWTTEAPLYVSGLIALCGQDVMFDSFLLTRPLDGEPFITFLSGEVSIPDPNGLPLIWIGSKGGKQSLSSVWFE